MPPRHGERRRVVVTGLGCVTPLGPDAPSTWAALLAGRSGVGPISRFDASGHAVRIAAEVAGVVDPGDLPAKERRRLDDYALYALAASREAVADAGLDVAAEGDRVGVSIGTAIGGIGTLTRNDRALLDGGPRRVSPFFVPMTISNMAGGLVAIRHGARGPNVAPVSACASGAHAIGDARGWIERGDVDVVLAGGSEAAVEDLVVAGFTSMRALSSRNDEPELASRPFDRGRDGFVVGEGAAVLVLEGLDHALARGARIRGELLGYAATADAEDIAQPSEDGAGAARCMSRALADAGLEPRAVDAINPHATSTPAGDRAEAAALRAVFGGSASRIPVSATKSMTGHLLGAAGAVEAVFSLLGLESGLLPPAVNLDEPDPACLLDLGTDEARAFEGRVALSNSFGFGGTNASLLLGSFRD